MFFMYIFFDENDEVNSANALRQDNETILESVEINRNSEQLQNKNEIVINSNNDTEDLAIHSRRTKRLGDKDILKINPEKLVILPSRTLQPPKMGKMLRVRFPKKDIEVFEAKTISSDPTGKVKNHRYSNHNMNANGIVRKRPMSPNRRQFVEVITANPRPFGFQITPPSAFKLPLTTSKTIPLDVQETQFHSIQDILNQEMANNDSNQRRRNHMIELTGTYRHPRQNDFTRLFIPTLSTVTPTTQIQPQPYFTPSYPQNFITDPFNNFRPSSPNDVNLLALNQLRYAPVQQVRIFRNHGAKPTAIINTAGNDMEMVYHKIIQANNQRLRNQQLSRYAKEMGPKQKPFSLMLDVYPMPSEDEDTAPTTRPIPIRIKKPPMSAFTGHDNSYFSTMNFPQIVKQKHPMSAGFYNNMYYKNMNPYKQIAGEESIMESVKHPPNKPSQLVLHLNLFPKNKKDGKNRTIVDLAKRSSKEKDEILVDHRGASSEIFGRKIQNYHKLNETSKNFINAFSSDESVDLTYPVSINLNLNGQSHETINHIDIPKTHSENINMSVSDNPSTTTVSPDMSYEDESVLQVSPSSAYTIINRKNKSKIRHATTTSTSTIHPILVESDEYTTHFHLTDSDYVNFDHKDARKYLK